MRDNGNYLKTYDVEPMLHDPRAFRSEVSPVASTTLVLPHLELPILLYFNPKVHIFSFKHRSSLPLICFRIVGFQGSPSLQIRLPVTLPSSEFLS